MLNGREVFREEEIGRSDCIALEGRKDLQGPTEEVLTGMHFYQRRSKRRHKTDQRISVLHSSQSDNRVSRPREQWGT